MLQINSDMPTRCSNVGTMLQVSMLSVICQCWCNVANKHGMCQCWPTVAITPIYVNTLFQCWPNVARKHVILQCWPNVDIKQRYASCRQHLTPDKGKKRKREMPTHCFNVGAMLQINMLCVNVGPMLQLPRYML